MGQHAPTVDLCTRTSEEMHVTEIICSYSVKVELICQIELVEMMAGCFLSADLLL